MERVRQSLAPDIMNKIRIGGNKISDIKCERSNVWKENESHDFKNSFGVFLFFKEAVLIAN